MPAVTYQRTFGVTGSAPDGFVVPDGITVLRFVCRGSSGVPVYSTDIGAGDALDGGGAAQISGYLVVTPGETLWIGVAEPADDGGPSINGAGFAVGGKAAGAASVIGRGPIDLEHALVVAAGGGGGGEDGTGGHGGGIGGRSAGTGGGGLGGGQDPTYTSSNGETTFTDGCAGGGGGVVGGRAGTVVNERRGGGGGGSSRSPAGATLSAGSSGRGRVELTWGIAPLAPTLSSPGPGEVVPAGRDVVLRHVFNGSGGGDTQTSASVVYTTTSGSGTAELVGDDDTAVIPAALAGTGPVSWQVLTRGQGGVAGPSASSAFTLAPAPAEPVLIAPVDGATATSPNGTAAWTAPEQAAYRLRVTNADASVVHFDSEVVADAVARQAPVSYASTGRTDVVRLAVRGANGCWSTEASARVPVAWSLPATPLVVVTSDPGTASLLVAVTHPVVPGRPPAVSTEFVALDLDSGELEGIVVGADGRWRNPRAGVEYVLAATARDALGVPATGTSTAPSRGYGASPYGAAPYGT